MADGRRIAFLLAFQADACRGLWNGLPPGLVMVPESWVPAPRGWPEPAVHSLPAGRPLRSRPMPGHRAWVEGVRRTTDAISAGQIEKAVLARRLDLTFDQPLDVAATVGELVRTNREATVWSWHLGGRDFLGASPELLLSYRQGRLQAACLAATRLDGGAGWQDKERREQAVVEDYVDRAFRRLGLRPVHTAISDLRQGPLSHLMATIEARAASPSTFYDLLALLHPTPALAGEPKSAALEWIRRQEPFSRGYYGGVVGWVEPTGEAEAVVAIRSALLQAHSAHLFAGSGLVAGSEPEAEWQETGAKLGVVYQALEQGAGDGQR